jgi:ArsR family transcriptional regulator
MQKINWVFTTQKANLFKTMGNNTRLAVIQILINNNELSVNDILEYFDKTTQPNLSQHLLKLTNAKILKATRKENYIYYKISNETIKKQLINLLEI